jgi:hypothetical protein
MFFFIQCVKAFSVLAPSGNKDGSGKVGGFEREVEIWGKKMARIVWSFFFPSALPLNTLPFFFKFGAIMFEHNRASLPLLS